MIATRRRQKRRNLTPIVLPLAALGALTLALVWPPSHNAIANGPLHPVWNVAGGVIVKPLTFADQNQKLANLRRDKLALNAQLESDRQAQNAKDAKISALQAQVSHLQAEPAPTPVALAPKPAASAGPLGASDDTVTPDVKRTATYWASMDAEKAAAIAQRLPDRYVNAVFAQMPADAVGEIMNALPPKTAAHLAADAAATGATTAVTPAVPR